MSDKVIPVVKAEEEEEEEIVDPQEVLRVINFAVTPSKIRKEILTILFVVFYDHNP